MNFERLFLFREKNNLKQKEVADIIGVSQQTYSTWEVGTKIIPLKHLNELCDYYKVSIDYILGLTDKNLYCGKKIILDKKKIGHNIKIIRSINNLTLRSLAKELNTTSSTIYQDIKDKYNFEIYPIVQSAAKLLAKLPIKRLGVFATHRTILSQAYPREIAKYNPDMEVFGQFCPEWVNIVEKSLINEEKSAGIIKNDLDKMLVNKPEKIVLGCTHYPFLTDILAKFAPPEMFIDPAEDFAEFIKDDLALKGLLNSSQIEGNGKFYVSANPAMFKSSAKLFYELEKEPELLTF